MAGGVALAAESPFAVSATYSLRTDGACQELTGGALGCTGLPEAGNRTGAMLFEVWVPKDAPAGVYKGTVSVLEGAAEIARLNLELTVLALTLPDVPTFAFDLLDYGLPAEGLGFKAQLNNGAIGTPATKIPEAAKAANYQVHKLAADNRCFKAGDVNGHFSDFVLYNGRASLGFDGALASRRLKLWCDSVNLYDYIAAARARDAVAADKLLARMARVGLSADKQYREQSKSSGTIDETTHAGQPGGKDE
jgi:hypothetical protein